MLIDHERSNGPRSARLLFLLFLLVPLVHLTLAPAPSSAQTADPPIFVAIADEFPDLDARAIVVREGPRDVIILKETEVTVEALDMSLRVLRRARERELDPNLGEIIPLVGFVPARISDERRAFLRGTLEELETRPTSSIGNFGTGRWMRFTGR